MVKDMGSTNVSLSFFNKFLDISYDDISEAITYFDDSPRLDFEGISTFFLKNCIASLYLPLQIMFW